MTVIHICPTFLKVSISSGLAEKRFFFFFVISHTTRKHKKNLQREKERKKAQTHIVYVAKVNEITVNVNVHIGIS